MSTDPAPSFMVFDDENGGTAAIVCVHASAKETAAVRLTVSARGTIIDLELSDHDAGVIADALQEWRKADDAH